MKHKHPQNVYIYLEVEVVWITLEIRRDPVLTKWEQQTSAEKYDAQYRKLHTVVKLGTATIKAIFSTHV